MQSVPARENTEQRSVPSSMSVDQLNVMLTDLQNKRTELLTKYPPTERLVLEIDDKIATTTAALQSARQNSMQENATNVNPVWEQVNSGAAQATTDIQALRNRSNHLGMQIAMLRGNLNGVESSTVDYTTLQQKVTELQANYQVYAQKRDQAQMADAMDQQHLLNVAVVQQPTLSTTPVRPQPVNNLILGGFTAVFLGMCVIFFAEMGRDTIASPQELEAVSSHPVLATVPFTRGERTSGLLPPERGKPLPPGFFSPPTGSGMRAAKTPAAVLASASTAMSAHPASAFEPKPAQAASASGNHWETLRTLLTQMPAAAVQNTSPAPLEHRPWETVGEAPVSLPREPLLESEPQKPAVQTPIITRSTVDHFPLPSVVPQQIASGLHAIASGVRSDVSSGDKPVATTVEAKPKQEIPPAPIETASATHELKQETTPNPQKQESPQSATDAPQASAPVHESRKSAILHEKLQNNWAENVAQRILGQRGSRSSAASLPTPEPRRNGAAEVVYNRQGKVEYVTYTVNPRNTDSRFGRIR